MRTVLLGVWIFISVIFVELMTKITAVSLTLALVGTLIWPFMDSGWWNSYLSYLYMGAGIGLLWLLSYLVKGIIKAMWKDRVWIRELIKDAYKCWRECRNEKA